MRGRGVKQRRVSKCKVGAFSAGRCFSGRRAHVLGHLPRGGRGPLCSEHTPGCGRREAKDCTWQWPLVSCIFLASVHPPFETCPLAGCGAWPLRAALGKQSHGESSRGGLGCWSCCGPLGTLLASQGPCDSSGAGEEAVSAAGRPPEQAAEGRGPGWVRPVREHSWVKLIRTFLLVLMRMSLEKQRKREDRA